MGLKGIGQVRSKGATKQLKRGRMIDSSRQRVVAWILQNGSCARSQGSKKVPSLFEKGRRVTRTYFTQGR